MADDRFDSRIDHNISERVRIWARGSYSNGPNFPFNGFGNLATPIGDGVSYNTAYNLALNSVYTFNPSTILNFSYGFARKINHKDPFSRGVDLQALGFPQAVAAAAAEQAIEFPRMDIGGNNGVTSLGPKCWMRFNTIASSVSLKKPPASGYNWWFSRKLMHWRSS